MAAAHVEIPGYDYDPERKRYFKKSTNPYSKPKLVKKPTNIENVPAKDRKIRNLLHSLRSRKTELECSERTDRLGYIYITYY